MNGASALVHGLQRHLVLLIWNEEAMTLSLKIALNYSFSSKHNLNDELDITTLMTRRVSACATDRLEHWI